MYDQVNYYYHNYTCSYLLDKPTTMIMMYDEVTIDDQSCSSNCVCTN